MIRAILLLVSGVLSLLVYGALILTDQWLQSGSPVAQGTVGTELDFTGKSGRYTVRMGHRGGFGKGPTVRINSDVARGALCLVTRADESTTVLQRGAGDDEGGITPLIGTFEPGEGRAKVLCRWERSEAFRGPLPVFVATERTTLRKVGYAALVAALLLLAAGGWCLYRAITRRAG